MSGKYAKKKNTPLVVAALVIVLVAVCAVVFLLLKEPADKPGMPAGTTAPTEAATETATETTPPVTEAATRPVQVEELDPASIALGRGMWITDIGKYTGVYMEDGSDEIVSGVMMIAVTNAGQDAIQYAEITLPVGDQTAEFSLTTLLPGSTVILLEKNRMEYVPGDYTEATVSSLALFQTPLSLCEDRLQIQILNGAINVTNISGADISGDIVIYYKNCAADVYYGGITYRVRLQGGLKAGEIRQIMASHFSASGSAIMFVTCGEN